MPETVAPALPGDPSLRLHDVLSLRERIRREDQGIISMVIIGTADALKEAR